MSIFDNIRRDLGMKSAAEIRDENSRLKRTRTCAGCIAYNSNMGEVTSEEVTPDGNTLYTRKGNCSLLFGLEDLPMGELHSFSDHCDTYIYHRRPAEPCPKPKTIKAYNDCAFWRDRNSRKDKWPK